MKTFLNWRELKPPPINTRNLVILSAGMVFLIFLLQGNAGFNLQDEGFLWYGTIRTALGGIPVRDFQAYDPGRYYWGALWFKLLRSDGMIALRISQAVFQFMGLTVAFLILRRMLTRWLAILTAGIVLMIWMFPAFKIYEPVIMIFAVYLAVLLIEKPSTRRHFAAGVFVGLAAFFGRNHGVYCFVAFLLLIMFIWWHNDRRALWKRLAIWSLGVVIGYLPMLLMLLLVPGFYGSFVEGLLFNLRSGTNLPLPVPWPWRITNYSHTFKEWLNKFGIGVTYLAFPIFYLLAGAALLLKPRFRRNSVLVASTLFGLAYLHYTFDRPHLYYLAWTVPPFIFGLIAVPYSFSERVRKQVLVIAWSSLIVLSWTAAEMAPENYFLIKAKGLVRQKLSRTFHREFALDMPVQQFGLVKTDVRGDTLWVSSDIADAIKGMNTINRQMIPANDNVLIAPYWTGFYPILRKESPTWEIYFLFPQPQSKQQKIVEDLERTHVNWALVCHYYLDDRPELAFEHTHSYVWQYLVTNFERVQVDGLWRQCELLRRSPSKGSTAPPPGASPTPAVK